MEARPWLPVGVISVEADEQLDMADRPEAKVVEHLDRGCVAGDRVDVHIRRAPPAGFLDGGLDQPPADSLPAVPVIDDARKTMSTAMEL